MFFARKRHPEIEIRSLIKNARIKEQLQKLWSFMLFLPCGTIPDIRWELKDFSSLVDASALSFED